MSKSKQPKPEATETKPATQAGELPDAALNQASGGALNAYMPANQTTAQGANAKAPGDGSVKTDAAMLACLKP